MKNNNNFAQNKILSSEMFVECKIIKESNIPRPRLLFSSLNTVIFLLFFAMCIKTDVRYCTICIILA